MNTKTFHTYIDLSNYESIRRYARNYDIAPGVCARIILGSIVELYYTKGFWVDEKKIDRIPKKKHAYKDVHITLDTNIHSRLGEIANDMKMGIGSCTRRLFRMFFLTENTKHIVKILSGADLSNFRVIKSKIAKRWRRWRKRGERIYCEDVRSKKKRCE